MVGPQTDFQRNMNGPHISVKMIKKLMAYKHLENYGLPQMIQFDGWPLISKKLWMVPDNGFEINEKPSNKYLKVMNGPYHLWMTPFFQNYGWPPDRFSKNYEWPTYIN